MFNAAKIKNIANVCNGNCDVSVANVANVGDAVNVDNVATVVN